MFNDQFLSDHVACVFSGGLPLPQHCFRDWLSDEMLSYLEHQDLSHDAGLCQLCIMLVICCPCSCTQKVCCHFIIFSWEL